MKSIILGIFIVCGLQLPALAATKFDPNTCVRDHCEGEDLTEDQRNECIACCHTVSEVATWIPELKQCNCLTETMAPTRGLKWQILMTQTGVVIV